MACLGAAIVSTAPLPVAAQSGWRVAWGLTVPYNLPMPLRIDQGGESELDITARYAAKPFDRPITWEFRLGRWRQGEAWELDLVHHKIYLDNGPPEVEKFSLSHGFNLLTLQRAWRRERVEWRVGTGLVLAHPESTVRGRMLAETGGPLGGGYYVAGPTASIAAARPIAVTHGACLVLESKLAISYASVPVAGGRAHVYNVFVQLAVLLGYGAVGATE